MSDDENRNSTDTGSQLGLDDSDGEGTQGLVGGDDEHSKNRWAPHRHMHSRHSPLQLQSQSDHHQSTSSASQQPSQSRTIAPSVSLQSESRFPQQLSNLASKASNAASALAANIQSTAVKLLPSHRHNSSESSSSSNGSFTANSSSNASTSTQRSLHRRQPSSQSHPDSTDTGTENAENGNLPVGTVLQLGTVAVIVDSHLAEGGFSHVYLVRTRESQMPKALKRILVPSDSRQALDVARNEVNVMRQLAGHKNIVRLFHSHVNQVPAPPAFEVYLLMDYCEGGRVVDIMNQRLPQRLTESEILRIFGDTCEAVAVLHYQQPPIAHRDIKVENVLYHRDTTFKLCDFGSCTTVHYLFVSVPQIGIVEDEIMKNTTLQYRAPEQCDLYLKMPINEKVDIWALGCFLYKLCFYATPFEEKGKLAILNADYDIPRAHAFSPALIYLIQSMLVVDPNERFNIYEVSHAVSTLRGLPCPIQNIYPLRSQRQQSTVQAPVSSVSQAPILRPLSSGIPSILSTASANITPMRRGRPNRQVPGPQATPALDHSAETTRMETTSSNNNIDVSNPPKDPFYVPPRHSAGSSFNNLGDLDGSANRPRGRAESLGEVRSVRPDLQTKTNSGPSEIQKSIEEAFGALPSQPH